MILVADLKKYNLWNKDMVELSEICGTDFDHIKQKYKSAWQLRITAARSKWMR